MAERITLDPSEVATSRTALDISDWIKADGVDWGDAEIQAYMADQSRGSSPVDFRVPNRMITMPLVLKDRGGTAFADIRSMIQAKAALFQREGGWLKRITAAGGTVYADVVNATLKLPGSWSQAHKGYDVEAQLTLEAIPDFYGNEVDLGDNVETTATELIFTETSIDGDYPARCRIVVDEDDGETQLGLIWGFRSRHYSAASTAALRYEAEALDPLDIAAPAALSGASGGTVVTHSALSTNWTPVLGTDLGGTAALTHTGTYRWWARVRTTSGVAVQLRSVWDVGDLTLPVENTPWQCRAGTHFVDADLGEIRLDPTTGTHRWQGFIQAKGAVSGTNVSIDKIWLVPVDEGYGMLRAPLSAEPGLVAYSARDEFTHAAGNLADKTAPAGGGWDGLGDTDDFTINTTLDAAQRATSSDTGLGRIVYLATPTLSTVVAQVDIDLNQDFTASGQDVSDGLALRIVDVNNQLLVFFTLGHNSTVLVDVQKQVSGVLTGLVQEELSIQSFQLVGNPWTIRALIDATGLCVVWVFSPGTPPGAPLIVVRDSVLASGGALDDGKVGIWDFAAASTPVTRRFKNFAAWPPIPDAVLHPNQSAELTSDGMYREDISGISHGPVSHVIGDLPRLPPSGLENRTTEVFLKASRGDLDQLPDSGIDDISARGYYCPSWLIVPG